MKLRHLGTTGIQIAPLVLGGNVFGWTADRDTSFAILDAFMEAGFNAIDTADVYSRFVPGMQGGESESIIGEWMQQRGIRDRMIIITKVGYPMGDGMEGLGRDYLNRACEASLRRLRTDYIDVYMTHRPDPSVPIAETLEALQGLIGAGKVRSAGCSNYSASEMEQALSAQTGQRARFDVVEPNYNLADRGHYEGPLESFCQQHSLGVIPYFALASGFLTGKYRKQADLTGRTRASIVSSYLTARNIKLLDVLDTTAEYHSATPAQIAIAWLMARKSVTAPIASATSLQQLAEIMRATEVMLTQADLARLNSV